MTFFLATLVATFKSLLFIDYSDGEFEQIGNQIRQNNLANLAEQLGLPKRRDNLLLAYEYLNANR